MTNERLNSSQALEKLRLAAPGFYRLVTEEARGLNPLEVAVIFFSVVESEGLEDKLVVRESTSFNPRPARIGSILIKERERSAPRIVNSGMLSLLSAASLNLFAKRHDSWAKEYIQLALSVNSSPHSHPITHNKDIVSTENLLRTEEHSAIKAAILLDHIRHLHMMNIERDEKLKAIGEAEEILALEKSFNSPLVPTLEVTINRARINLQF